MDWVNSQSNETMMPGAIGALARLTASVTSLRLSTKTRFQAFSDDAAPLFLPATSSHTVLSHWPRRYQESRNSYYLRYLKPGIPVPYSNQGRLVISIIIPNNSGVAFSEISQPTRPLFSRMPYDEEEKKGNKSEL